MGAKCPEAGLSFGEEIGHPKTGCLKNACGKQRTLAWWLSQKQGIRPTNYVGSTNFVGQVSIPADGGLIT